MCATSCPGVYVRKFASTQVLAQVKNCETTRASACFRKYATTCSSAQMRECASACKNTCASMQVHKYMRKCMSAQVLGYVIQVLAEMRRCASK